MCFINDLFGKMSTKDISKSKIIMTVLLVVFVVTLTLLEFYHMNSTTTDECWKTLNEAAVYVDYGLKTMFSGNLIALSNSTNQFAKFADPKGKEVASVIKNTSAGVTHSEERVYYADGDILTKDGFVQRTNNMPKFEEIVSYEPRITGIHYDSILNKNVIEHMMPVVKNDEVIAMASVILLPDDIASLVPVYGYENKARFFVVDKNSGDILINEFENIGNNLFEGKDIFFSAVSGYSLGDWFNDIQNGTESNIAIKIQGNDKNQYIRSVQAFNSDWCICIAADSDVVFSRVYKMRMSFIVFICLELAFFFLYLYWLLKVTRKTIKEETEHGYNIINTLASDYEFVYAGNLETDEALIIRMSERLNKIFKSVDMSIKMDDNSYSRQLTALTDRFVHPEDRHLFLYNILGEGVKTNLREGRSLAYEFRAGVNGSFRHFTVKVVPNKAESDTSVVLGFRDIEKEYKFRCNVEEEEAKKRVLLEEAKNYSVVAGLSDDYDYVAHINYRTAEVTRYKINERFSKLIDEDNQNFTSYERFKQCAQKILYKDDYDKVMSLIDKENVLDTVKNDKVLRIECRFVIDGEPEYFRVKFVGDSKDEESAIVGLLNIDDLVRNDRKQKEQAVLLQNMELLRILSDQFEVVYDVNIETGEYEEITKEGEYAEHVSPKLVVKGNFFTDVIGNTKAMLHEDDIEEALKKTDREYLIDTLSKKPFEEWNYRIKMGDGFVWYRMRIKYKDSSKKHVIFGLFNINDGMKQKEAIRIFEQDALFYQRAILNNAFNYYKVNLTKNRIISPIIERVNGNPEDCSYKFGNPLPLYDEVVEMCARKYVHDDYKVEYTEELLSDKLISKFKEGDVMPEYTCMIWSGSLGLHFSKYVNYMIKDEVTGDILSMVVVYDVSEEKQKEIEKRQYIEQIMSLSEDFESIYDINLDTGRYSESIKNGKFDEPILNEIVPLEDYFERQKNVIEELVYSEDKMKVSNEMSREGILGKLVVEDGFYLDFRCVFDERIVWYRMRVSKIGDWNQERRILVGMINNDENMKKEKEQQEMLEHALMMANSANRAKTTFLNSMSHDIRTPMNAIIGFTGLASSHIENKEKVQDYLGKIKQSSEHLLSLINAVLDMSRIESGKVYLKENEESISDIIHSLKSIVAADINANKLDFCIDSLMVTNEKVICDKLRINQVLLNLISNSIKYTQKGGRIRIRIEQTESKKEGCAKYVFYIKDNGMGMSEEYVKTIFEPFSRENSATVSGIQGTGLGMSITKNIVDLMEGHISVKSEKNVGTEFMLELDLKLVKEDMDVERIDEFADRKTILLSNDKKVRERVSIILEKIGIVADCFDKAEDAYLAITKASSEGKAYSLVLTDFHIEGTNENDLIENLRNKAGEEATIVVLSVCDIADGELPTEGMRINGIVPQPMFPSDIYKTLKKCLSGSVEEKIEIDTEKDYSEKKVLLVEDNALNREIACELLNEIGVETETAEDGTVAVEMFKEYDKFGFDLVLMDIQMPMMDGYETTKQIRGMENGRFADIPIVAMTANAFEEDKKEAMDVGMNDHIAKPIDFNKLIEVLNTYL